MADNQHCGKESEHQQVYKCKYLLLIKYFYWHKFTDIGTVVQYHNAVGPIGDCTKKNNIWKQRHMQYVEI